MAYEEEVIIDVQVQSVEAVKRQQELKTALEAVKEQQKQLRASGDTLSDTYVRNEAQIRVLNQQIAANGRILNGLVDTTNEAGGAYAELSRQAAIASQRARDMSIAYGSADERTIEATASARALRDQLARSDESVGNGTRSVGLYSQALEGLDMAGGGVVQSFKGMLASAKAFIANPIGLVIAAIAGAAVLLYKAFSRTQENTEKLSKVTGALSGLFNNLLKILEPVAVFLVDKLVSGFELAMKAIDGTVTLIAKGLKLVGLEEASKKFQDFGDNAKKAAESGVILAEAEAKLEKQQRASRKIQLEYQNAAEKLRQIRDDESKSTAERIKANKDLGAVLKKQSNEELSIANNAVAVAKLRVDLNGATKDSLDELAAKETEVADIKERITGQESEQLANINSLRKEAAEKQAAREKDIADKRKARLDNEKEAEKELSAFKLQTLKENADADIKALEYEAKMYQLKNQERLAGQKLTDEQLYIQNIEAANKAYTDELARQNVLLEQKQITQTEYNEQLKLNQQQLNTDLALIDADNEAKVKENKIAAAATDFENKMAIAEAQGQLMFDFELLQSQKTSDAELAEAEKTGADKALIRQKYALAEEEIERRKRDAILSMASGAIGNLATIAGKGTKVGKAAASAQVAVDTYRGAMGAIASMSGAGPVGWVAGAIQAASVIATGVKSVKDIWAVKSGLPGDGGSGGSSISSTAVAAPAAVTGGLVARSSGQTQVQGTQQAVSNALEQNPQQPVLLVPDVTQMQGQIVQLKSDNSL